MSAQDPRFVVYGYRLSYATRKLEMGLRLLEAPLVLEPMAWERRRALERLAGADTVPVVCLPDLTWLAGANDVLDWAEDQLRVRKRGHGLSEIGELGLLIALLEAWHDEWVWRCALHWRWNKPRAWALASDAFAREALPDGPHQLIEPVASLYADWGTRALRARGLYANGAAAAAADALLFRWLDAIERQLAETPYLLGERATRVDAAVLGLLRAHFAMDPESGAVFRTFQRTRDWLEAAHGPLSGQLAPWSEPTGFARFVLQEAGAEFAAYLHGNRRALAERARGFDLETGRSSVHCLPRQELESVRLGLASRAAGLPARALAVLLAESPGLAAIFQDDLAPERTHQAV